VQKSLVGCSQEETRFIHPPFPQPSLARQVEFVAVHRSLHSNAINTVPDLERKFAEALLPAAPRFEPVRTAKLSSTSPPASYYSHSILTCSNGVSHSRIPVFRGSLEDSTMLSHEPKGSDGGKLTGGGRKHGARREGRGGPEGGGDKSKSLRHWGNVASFNFELASDR
jgi:hypothetical protein